MNRDDLMSKVTDALDLYKPAQSGLYVLFVKNRKIGLCRQYLAEESQHKIAILNSRDINEGCMVTTWERIREQIAKLMKQGII